MQQFVVPQFIDVEDKIIGPITTRQFLILLITAGIVGLCYRFFDLALFGLSLAIIGGGAIVIAFVPINGRPFHFFLLNLAQTVRRPSRRIWFKSYTHEELDYLRKRDSVFEAVEMRVQKTAKRDRIHHLALQVNTGGYYRASDHESTDTERDDPWGF